MDLVGGIVSGVAATKEAKDRKKVMKEEKKDRDKKLEMEEERHKLFMENEREKSKKEKEKLALETDLLRKEKEKIELEIKKLDDGKLKSEDSGVSSRQKRESVSDLEKEKERLEIEMKKLDLQQKEQQVKKITEDSADKDSQFIEAATEGNIKMLTLLSKNIEELDLDYIKAAHDIAMSQGNPTVSRLTQLALDKKNKIENSKIEDSKSKVESCQVSQKSGPAGSKEEDLVPEAKFGQSKHNDHDSFSEVVVKTMPDGSIMKTTRTKKGLHSRPDKSHISTNDDFPSFEDKMFSSGFEGSVFGRNFGDFGNLGSRVGQGRLLTDSGNLGTRMGQGRLTRDSDNLGSRMGQGLPSTDSMFSGREGFPKMRSMMNDDSFNSSRFDMNFKSINK